MKNRSFFATLLSAAFIVIILVLSGCAEDGTDGINGQNYVATNALVSGWNFPTNAWDTVNPPGYVNSNYPAKGAIDASGNAVVVWLHRENGLNKDNLYLAHNFSGTWTKPHLADHLNSVENQSVTYPSVGMDNNGNTVVSWLQNDGTNDRVYIAEYRSGGWTAPAAISIENSNAKTPALAVDAAGKAVVAWTQTDGTHDQIFKSDYGITSASAWSHPTTASTDSISPAGQTAKNPHVAAGDGSFLITWVQNDSIRDQIFSSDYKISNPASDTWHVPTGLTDNHSPDAQASSQPQGAVDNGKALIVWKQSDGSKTQTFKSDYGITSASTWSDPTSDTDNISPDTQDVDLPQVAFNGGKAAIVWRQSQGSYKQIFRSDYNITNADAWTHPATLDNYISMDASNTDDGNFVVAIDGSGNVVIAWEQELHGEEDTYNLYKAEYRNGSWTRPAGLSDHFTVMGSSSSDPMVDISVNDNGNMIMTWSENTFEVYYDTGYYNVFKGIYKP